MTERLQVHPLCELLPPLRTSDPEGYEALVADMLESGYVGEPVVMYEGKILDGRNRYEAWCECGHDGDIPRVAFDGDKEAAWALVKRNNFVRRHLTQFQKSLIELQHLKNTSICTSVQNTITDAELGAMAGVSRPTASTALDVFRCLPAETVSLCIDGVITRSAAEEMIAPAMKQQTKAEKDAEEDKAEFYATLGKVLGGKYTREGLATAFGLKKPGAEIKWFIRCCEVAPDVIVIRGYGERQRAYFEFRRES